MALQQPASELMFMVPVITEGLGIPGWFESVAIDHVNVTVSVLVRGPWCYLGPSCLHRSLSASVILVQLDSAFISIGIMGVEIREPC